ncbi:arsenate reductase [Sphingomonas bacterium]|uniref:arsenate reductase n=1 Tax=Sphingomonas bacterium TaxID=1895847 RepID=UPI001575E90E|nr:arsenate reductase [Sphingomonas bacterium]
MTVTLHGIRDCDTVKKARAWLDAAGVAYAFHDYKTAGVPEQALRTWVDRLGWESLLNRAGTTFRKLPDADKADLDAPRAVSLMLAHSSAIRRPVLVHGDALLVGFDPARDARQLRTATDH